MNVYIKTELARDMAHCNASKGKHIGAMTTIPEVNAVL